jgi:predicted NBD/HSP70 family sugar kinase
VTLAGESDAVQRGPNARVYQLAADRAHVAGMDVRTGSVSLVVANITGAVVTSTSLRIAGDGRSAATAAVDALAGAVARSGGIVPHTVAVGGPGLIDPGTGQLRSTPGLPRWHADLAAALGRLDVHVVLENEVNLAALAEFRQGAAQDRGTFVLLWLGHGVGAGAVLDGRLRRGASGGTGEIGFLAVPGTGGLPSATGCGQGFHALAGSAAVCGLARRHGFDVVDSGDASAAKTAVRSALAAERRGDQRGLDFMNELARNIALGALAICVVLDPGCLVLGGEVGRAGGRVLAGLVASHLSALSPLRTEVRAAQVPESAVLAGAVLTALDAAHADLFGPPLAYSS